MYQQWHMATTIGNFPHCIRLQIGLWKQESHINFPEIYHKTQLNINITKIYYLNSHITLQISLTIPHFLILQFKVKNFYFKAIVSFLYSLRPMEATWILGENTLCCMDGKGRYAMRQDQRGSHDQSKTSWKAGRKVSLEARTILHNKHMFLKIQYL